ncbi:MAG: capsule assembly Wzi family protein [Gemmatimonadota bacterium]|nr:capsule assembly Wzi family protein [Gemmatimonadota bacterium]
MRSCVTALSILIAAMSATRALAQQTANAEGSFVPETFAGSVSENYLRYLQTAGLVKTYPWASRGFSPRELDRLIPRDTAHPWMNRFAPLTQSVRGIRYGIIPPRATFRYNTGSAYGSGDGPIWAGRGLTSAVQLGASARWGPVSLTLAPTAFRAENRAFFVMPNGRDATQALANPFFEGIDLPERFGSSPYSRLDAGESTLRIDLPFVSMGASTANMGWGPGTDYPLLLGNNAAGFPHIFVGSSEPINIFVARLHGRLMWGELSQSEFSPVTGPKLFTSKSEPGRKRFATGLVLALQPRGIPGLEVGAARFFHSVWPRSGIPRSYWTKSFQAFLKERLERIEPLAPGLPAGERGVTDNQLVEVFARWVLPRSGFELSAEYGRDDHSEDARDLIQEPDHSRFYNIGLRKVMSLNATSVTAGRFEIINFQLPQLSNARGEGEIYVHGLIRQGHTQRGQLLGANVGVGAAAGSTLAVDRFTTSGRWTASWKRELKAESGQYTELGIRNPRSINVSHAVGFEMTRFTDRFDLTGGLTFVREFNRYFLADASNINAVVGVRYNVP